MSNALETWDSCQNQIKSDKKVKRSKLLMKIKSPFILSRRSERKIIRTSITSGLNSKLRTTFTNKYRKIKRKTHSLFLGRRVKIEILDNPEPLVNSWGSSKLGMESLSCLMLYVSSTPLALIKKCGSVFCLFLPSSLLVLASFSEYWVVVNPSISSIIPIVCVLPPQSYKH